MASRLLANESHNFFWFVQNLRKIRIWNKAYRFHPAIANVSAYMCFCDLNRSMRSFGDKQSEDLLAETQTAFGRHGDGK